MFNKEINIKAGKKMTSCKEVFKTEWFSIEAVSYNDSNEKPYYRLSCDDSVGILAVTSDQKIILVRQFRPAIGMHPLELPSGYLDKKESMEDAIKRELLEETGFVCDSVTYVGPLQVCLSRIDSTHHIFFGKGAKKISAIMDKKEIEEINLVTQDEFEKLIIEKKFLTSSGIATYYLAKIKGLLQ